MNAPADRLAIALAQLNPTVGDVAGNAEKVRRARATAAGRAPTSLFSPSCSSPAIRPKIWCSSRRSRPPAARRSRRWRARPPTAGRPCWSARPGSRTASSTMRMLLLDGRQIAALRFKVDLPNYGVFDEKRVFAPGPMPGPIMFRGVRLGVPICEDIWGPDVGRVPRRNRRRDSARAERLALLARQDRDAAQHRGRARHRERAAAHLSQQGRRPGRARVRRRLVRAQCRPLVRVPASGVPRSRGHDAVGARERHAGAA